ncbi:MAG TPA: carbohydrate kinase family protein [Chloroflexia bacterium]|nr:carbohydrate kinase family protein [Chloroflexia bacterium]
MSKILVSGLINIETTLLIEGFPVDYSPVRYPFYGVNSSVAGVGYNIARALTVLGNQVNFLSLNGRDISGKLVREALIRDRIPGYYVLESLDRVAQAVILYEKSGRRQINTDLKDIQDQTYPNDLFDRALEESSLAVLCNINFSRPFLVKARQAGKLIATDVHAISSLDDEYNRDFMQHADILFMSHELLPTSPEEWAWQVLNRYGNEIIVIGMGSQGALLSVKKDRFMQRIPAVVTRPVVNSIGAGDALFSAFVHSYNRKRDPYEAIKKAVLFASYKIGVEGAAEGFLDEKSLEALYASRNHR